MEVLTETELDEARCAAVLARYLPLGEEKAEAWAEILCRRRSAPLPGEADSGEGYTLREVQRAAQAYAAVLRTGEWPALGSLLDELRSRRRRWADKRQHELDAGQRRQLEAGEDTDERRERDREQSRAVIAALMATLASKDRGID